jgi:hypothetical protein
MAEKRHFEVVVREGGNRDVLLVTDSEQEAIRCGQEYAGRHPHASITVSEESFDAPSNRFVARRVWSCRGRPMEEKKSFVLSPMTGRFIVKR